MKFSKYHGLGNDYIVTQDQDWPSPPTPDAAQRICDRHFGLGSDGLLVWRRHENEGEFRVGILNPDGSEAEKSGNGLRILARHLYDHGLVPEQTPFHVHTLGGRVTCSVTDAGRTVTVHMGQASFDSRDIPVGGPPREVLKETMSAGGTALEYSAVTVGNPHCVIFRDPLSAEETCELGPLIEADPRFPNRTNVQFAHVRDRQNLQIEIWERGAGYTLASGSSSCAVAAVARRLGLCDSKVAIHMPGGALAIEVSDTFDLTMTGPVVKVAQGLISREIFT